MTVEEAVECRGQIGEALGGQFPYEIAEQDRIGPALDEGWQTTRFVEGGDEAPAVPGPPPKPIPIERAQLFGSIEQDGVPA